MERILKGNEFTKKAAAKLAVSEDKVIQIVKDAIPDHLIADINNMYFQKSKNHEFCKIDDTNKPKLDLLTSVNDARSKIITNGNYINSNIYTKEITDAILKSIMEALTEEEIKDLADGMKNSNGGEGEEGEEGEGEGNETEGGESKFSKAMKKLMDAKDSNGNSKLSENVRNARARASKKISDLKDAGIDTGDLEEKYGKDASKMLQDIDKIRSEAQGVNFNRSALKPIIDNIINKSISFFSRRYTTTEVSIFDSEVFDEFDGLENLHPIFKNVQLGDVVTRENRYFGKMNIYIDVSGSMSSEVNCDGKNVSAMVFAKALALELHAQRLLTRVIPFGSDIKPILDPVTVIDILFLNAHCGTDFSKVINDCEKRQENALIITDGCEFINRNTTYGFFIGTPGATFSLAPDAEAMRDNGQIWTFNEDGTDVVRC